MTAPGSRRDRPDFVVKICGITRLEDGAEAVAGGADWLGFIRWPGSKRYQDIDECVELMRRLRAVADSPFEAVGVYVNAELDTIENECERLGLDRIQLHGDEPAEFAARLSRPVVKAIRVRDAASLSQADAFADCDLLTDAYVPDQPGGTGRSYDHRLVEELVSRRRVIVSGGLRPENVGEVIRALRPWGVDVSSGVERAPGVKDHARLRTFLTEARQAIRETAMSARQGKH